MTVAAPTNGWTRELFDAVRAKDRRARWHPEVGQVQLRDGTWLPNAARAEAWLGEPAPRPQLHLLAGGLGGKARQPKGRAS